MSLTDEQIARLRQSGIRLDRDGRFWHEGQEVTHFGLRDALWRWLDRDADGRYVLRLDAERFVYIDVEDLPQVVRSLRWDGDRALAVLADGTEEELDCSTVRQREGGGASCTVRGGRLEARIATAAWGVLAERLRDEDGVPWLDARGGPFRIDGR
jgi:hypothetical protein